MKTQIATSAACCRGILILLALCLVAQTGREWYMGSVLAGERSPTQEELRSKQGVVERH